MGTTVEDVIASPSCHLDEFQTGDSFYCDGKPAPELLISLDNFDRRAFLTDVEQFVIQPIEETVALFASQRYMTRFYTTLSPDEMNADPVFSLNADLDDVDNQHTLPLRYDSCNVGDISGEWEADFGGKVVRGEGTTWPLTLATKAQDMPVNLRILQLAANGAGEVYEDNGADIATLLEAEFGLPTTPPSGSGGPGGPGGTPTVAPFSSSGGGCSLQAASSKGSGHAAALLSLLGVAVLTRRGRARRRR
jgi:hypothetical protein